MLAEFVRDKRLRSYGKTAIPEYLEGPNFYKSIL